MLAFYENSFDSHRCKNFNKKKNPILLLGRFFYISYLIPYALFYAVHLFLSN